MKNSHVVHSTVNSPANMVAPRKEALTSWVNETLDENLQAQAAPVVLESLGSDAGFRRYYRLTPSPYPTMSLLAVDAPPATENSDAFVMLAKYLRTNGINAPAVIAADIEQGFLLIEDFGDQLLHTELNADTVAGLYGEALMTLLRLQQCTEIPVTLPRYDQAMLRRELEIFSEWFVGNLLGYSLTAQDRELLSHCFARLEAAALEQPQVLVHRDYHSRNLLVCESGNLGVIDFQGAVQGPICYDLVSLLRDCYIRWPREDVKRWALGYGNMAVEVGILPEVDEDQYLRWFDFTGLQRHIKVLGIFARLHLRDGKAGYLNDLSLVIRYTLEVADNYPELDDFVRWFKQQLLPLAQQQSWYTDYHHAGDQPA